MTIEIIIKLKRTIKYIAKYVRENLLTVKVRDQSFRLWKNSSAIRNHVQNPKHSLFSIIWNSSNGIHERMQSAIVQFEPRQKET